jgi:hypothetical protein
MICPRLGVGNSYSGRVARIRMEAHSSLNLSILKRRAQAWFLRPAKNRLTRRDLSLEKNSKILGTSVTIL